MSLNTKKLLKNSIVHLLTPSSVHGKLSSLYCHDNLMCVQSFVWIGRVDVDRKIWNKKCVPKYTESREIKPFRKKQCQKKSTPQVPGVDRFDRPPVLTIQAVPKHLLLPVRLLADFEVLVHIKAAHVLRSHLRPERGEQLGRSWCGVTERFFFNINDWGFYDRWIIGRWHRLQKRLRATSSTVLFRYLLESSTMLCRQHSIVIFLTQLIHIPFKYLKKK